MDVNIGLVFLIQIVIGTLGNFSLLSQYLFLYFSGCRSRSIDLILRHLTVANLLVILSRGIPETMAAFGVEHFLSDFGCKLVFYVHRVGRGVTIGNTCLLGVFQATIISSRWAELKVKAQKYMSACTMHWWVLHLLLNITFPASVTAKRKNTNITKEADFAYCSARGYEKFLSVTVILFSILDVLCLVLMLGASVSMVFILHRHKQQVQHIHRTNVSSTSSHETKAIYSILILVCTYINFYTISCFIQVCLAVFHNHHSLFRIAAFINACFPTLCPFLFMSQDHSLFRTCGHYCENSTWPPNFIRKKYTLSVFSCLSAILLLSPHQILQNS